jgi:hypothetical protein
MEMGRAERGMLFFSGVVATREARLGWRGKACHAFPHVARRVVAIMDKSYSGNS